jgi:hypothetical protein
MKRGPLPILRLHLSLWCVLGGQYLLERGQLPLVVIHLGSRCLVAAVVVAAVVVAGRGLLELEGDGAPLGFPLLPRPDARAPSVPEQGAAICFPYLPTDGRETNFETALCPQKQLHVVEEGIRVVFVPFYQLLE